MVDNMRTAERPSRIDRLCRACVRRTGVDGGGVAVLSSQRSPLLLHATDDVARVVIDLQFTLGQGPSVDAATSGVPVLLPDTTEQTPHSERWPALLAELDALDVRAVFAFPIRVGAISLGMVDLYRHAPGALDPDQVAAGVTTGSAIGDTLISAESQSDADLRFPMTVHRAAGMVMVQMGVSIEDALVVLRAAAYRDGVEVTAVAAQVLSGSRRFSEEQS